MKNMKKQILLRSAIGFPIGVCISSLIILVISFCIGTYAPCSPGCTALFGSETAGATAHLGSGIVEFIPCHRHPFLHGYAPVLGRLTAAGLV